MRYIWILILAISSVFVAKTYFSHDEAYIATKIQNIKEERAIKLAFVGDIMLDRQVEDFIKEHGGGDFKFPFLNIASKLSEYDFLFGNLEGPISSRGVNVGSKYSFRMDPLAIDGLKYAGFDALSVANNHSGDWGRDAFADTISILRNNKIVPVGASTIPEFIEIKGLKIALLGFSDFPTPAARATEEDIRNSVYSVQDKADLLIVSFHFGEEYQKLPSMRQKELAKLAVDSGADLVIGHHPHVSQPLEKYNDSYIAYSLGNFVFDQYFSEDTMRGSLLEIIVKNKGISEAKLRDIKLNTYYQPSLID